MLVGGSREGCCPIPLLITVTGGENEESLFWLLFLFNILLRLYAFFFFLTMPHLVRTQSLNVLPLKPGVGPYIAMHATLTARYLFLISTLPVHSPAFFF